MLGLFNKKDKRQPENEKVNSFGEPLDKLVDGELPWGWVFANKDFVDKISTEWSVFLHRWVESRNASITEQYGALKSLVMYLEDAQKLCIQKGECFAYWFDGCIASQDFIEKRKTELVDIEEKIQQRIEHENN